MPFVTPTSGSRPVLSGVVATSILLGSVDVNAGHATGKTITMPRVYDMETGSASIDAAVPLGLTFSIIEPAQNSPCCTSPFFLRFISELRSRPEYVAEPRRAHLLFTNVDTLRMCEWPRLRMRPDGLPGCMDGVTWDPSAKHSAVGANRSCEEGISDDCNWCCAEGTDAVTATIRAVAEELGPGKAFVFFKNAQDTHFGCGEFSRATAALEGIGADVIFVGFQLQRSQLAKPGASRRSDHVAPLFPGHLLVPRQPPDTRGTLPGVNLLVPLLPGHSRLPESDDVRAACKERHWLASFSGQRSTALREELFQLANTHPRIHIYRTNKFGAEDPGGYERLLRDSVFAFVPRGDEHYTFRLTEVLAAGAVPVVIDDDYVAPFNRQDMDRWAIHLAESEVSVSPTMLELLSNETICSLKRNGSAIWHRARNVSTMVHGMLEGLQTARRSLGRRSLGGAEPAGPAELPPPPPSPPPPPPPPPSPPPPPPPPALTNRVLSASVVFLTTWIVTAALVGLCQACRRPNHAYTAVGPGIPESLWGRGLRSSLGPGLPESVWGQGLRTSLGPARGAIQ